MASNVLCNIVMICFIVICAIAAFLGILLAIDMLKAFKEFDKEFEEGDEDDEEIH